MEMFLVFSLIPKVLRANSPLQIWRPKGMIMFEFGFIELPGDSNGEDDVIFPYICEMFKT